MFGRWAMWGGFVGEWEVLSFMVIPVFSVCVNSGSVSRLTRKKERVFLFVPFMLVLDSINERGYCVWMRPAAVKLFLFV